MDVKVNIKDQGLQKKYCGNKMMFCDVTEETFEALEERNRTFGTEYI